MSKSLLYHAFGLRGYAYRATRYENGKMILVIDQPRESYCCPACGSGNVFSQGQVTRRFRTLPIGKKTVEIEFDGSPQSIRFNNMKNNRKYAIYCRNGDIQSTQWLQTVLVAHFIVGIITNLVYGYETQNDRTVEYSSVPTRILQNQLNILPELLFDNATIEASGVSLEYFTKWLYNSHDISVIVDYKHLESADSVQIDGLTIQSQMQPIIKILDGLRRYGIGWYVNDGVITITSVEHTDERYFSIIYECSDLLGDSVNFLDKSTFVNFIAKYSRGEWKNSVEGNRGGSISICGHSLFVSQTDWVHREICRLLYFLHASKCSDRVIFVSDDENNRLWEILNEKISVEFHSIPLKTALKQLSHQSGIKIQVLSNLPEDEPLNLERELALDFNNVKISAVLDAMFLGSNETWYPHEGIILISNSDSSDGKLELALYDIENLSKSIEEAQEIADFLVNDLGIVWEDSGGEGTILVLSAHQLAICQTDHNHLEIMKFLDTANKLKSN